MAKIVMSCLLSFGAVGCGLMAGVYFAFSVFIMTALARIEQAQGISAMNSISSTILNSLFMPFFVGTTIVSLILVVMGVIRRREPGAIAMIAGGLIYIAGMFLCTMFFNVPLNNELLAVNPASVEAAPIWARYLKDWTFWNHVRTISSSAASTLYIAAIIAKRLAAN